MSRGIAREKWFVYPQRHRHQCVLSDGHGTPAGACGVGRLVTRANWIGKSRAHSIPLRIIPLFLKAAACVAAERPDVRFVCVGHGDASYLNQLKELTRTLGIENNVQWVQARPDMRAVYNALDVFCSASSSEGFPNVIGEAMACARNCVVTDVGDSKLVVGGTGITVKGPMMWRRSRGPYARRWIGNP